MKMDMLTNLRYLESINLLNIISFDLSLKKEILRADEFYKIYSNDMEKLYSILPIETYDFLKIYFENKKKVPATRKFTQCLNALRNCGVAEAEMDHSKNVFYTYDMVYGRTGYESETVEFLKSDEEFYNVKLDDKLAKKLFKFLSNNEDLIKSEKKIKAIIKKNVRKHFNQSIFALKTILKSDGFEIENLLTFIKNKLEYGIFIIDYYDDEVEENPINVKRNIEFRASRFSKKNIKKNISGLGF